MRDIKSHKYKGECITFQLDGAPYYVEGARFAGMTYDDAMAYVKKDMERCYGDLESEEWRRIAIRLSKPMKEWAHD